MCSIHLWLYDSAACNYDSTANTSDGSCWYAEYYDCDDNCLVDTDGDGTCDELEVLGCDDPAAFNYDTSATEDDGSCIAVALGCTNSAALITIQQQILTMATVVTLSLYRFKCLQL